MAIIQGNAVSAGGFYPQEIEQSLRFNDDDSAYLSWTPASAPTDGKIWTFSSWVKRGEVDAFNAFFTAYSGSVPYEYLAFNSDGSLRYDYITAGPITHAQCWTDALFRDPSAWYHVVVRIDTTQATASDRIRLWVNGVQYAMPNSSTGGAVYPNSNDTSLIGSNSYTQGIGRNHSGYFDGYLAETHFIDGTAYTASDFGEFKNGVWIPKAFAGTYGTNGFYLKYADGGALGTDSSGNGNTWTPTNLAATDVMLDSPTNNFATLNPVDGSNQNISLLEGNLKFDDTAANGLAYASFAIPPSGAWYFEGVWLTLTTPNTQRFGIASQSSSPAHSYSADGEKVIDGSSLGNLYASYTTGDIVGIAFNSDTSQVSFYKNNTLQSTESVTGGVGWFPYVYTSGATGQVGILNFGQDSSFAGNKVAQGNVDANGIGDFYYAPPAGYLALCTANLPEPAIGPNSATTSDEHFNTVLYTGDGTAGHAITGVGFQPDLTWMKKRNTPTRDHTIFDAVRGASQWLSSSLTDAETTQVAMHESFDSDGFTVGANSYNNESGSPHVAWNWKADNTSGVSNTDGTITSTVSANVDAGFSVVSYTGTGVAATVGHGLSQAPDMIIVKNRGPVSTEPWRVWHTGYSSIGFTTLNDTTAFVSNSTVFTSAPSASVVNIGTSVSSNESAKGFIAYCFHSVEGYSRFGSYTGNGSADGPFIFTNFRPAFVMVKRTDSTSSWVIWDNTRQDYNPEGPRLYPDASDAEDTGTHLDFLSNGFKLRYTGLNVSGGTYIYMAFAESGGPFKYSNAR